MALIKDKEERGFFTKGLSNFSVISAVLCTQFAFSKVDIIHER